MPSRDLLNLLLFLKIAMRSGDIKDIISIQKNGWICYFGVGPGSLLQIMYSTKQCQVAKNYSKVIRKLELSKLWPGGRWQTAMHF